MERQKLFNERPYTKFTQHIEKAVILLDVHKKITISWINQGYL